MVAATLPTLAGGDDEQFINNDAWSVQGALTELLTKKSQGEAEAPSKKAWKRDDFATMPKFGGYIIGTYKYNDTKGANNGDGFGLRLIRLYLDGTVMKDFNYRLQLEVNGNPHVKDAFVEWAHWNWLKVKAGQFKRCFTFENPYNPWDVGVGDYGLVVKKLSGFGDRCGETSMGGRDMGVQLQGDLLKSKKDGHYQLHYQAAVFNGQGINRKDENKGKDFMGTLQYSPVKNLWIGAFGWKGQWTGNDFVGKAVTVDRDRYGFGVKYEGTNGWSARSEYVRSRGYKAADYTNGVLMASNSGRHADGWYATVGVPVWRWIKCYARYDAYRDDATNATLHNLYGVSANLQPHKNLMLQVQYNYGHDKTRNTDRGYNQFWTQMYVRF